MSKLFLIWFVKIRRLIKQRLGIPNTVLLLSLFTGIFGATVAIILKNLLHFTTSLLSNAFPGAEINYLYLAFPFIGIVLTMWYVVKIVKDNISHGVSIVLKSMFKSKGKLRRHNIYSSMIAGTITVGFGGSVGLEAPIVLTGSAVGSNLAQLFNLSPKNIRLLLACGSTAAMAAIFKAPVAAIVFAIEVLMLDLTTAAILPLLFSAATGTLLSILFLGEDVMFSIPFTSSYQLHNIPFYLLLGIFAGFISVYFLRMLRFIEKWMAKFKNRYIKIIFGGLFLGGMIFLFPNFYGEGYESINTLINGNAMTLFENSPLSFLGDSHVMFMIFILLVIFIKVIAMSVTLTSGGIGGVFAPTLFIGAYLGFFVAEIINHYFGFNLPIVNFILAGMAGVMTGVMHSPLTAIFLTAELSTGYNLLIPLMVTAAVAYLTSHPFEKHSVYTKKLAETGYLKTHNKDKFAMKRMRWQELIDHDIMTIPIHSSLRDYTSCIAKCKRNIFVVLNKDDSFAGLLVMDDHRDILFKQELYDLVFVKDLMFTPDMFVYETDNGEEVIHKFNITGNFNLPVITKDGKYIGFLSKTKVLTAYKEFIASESED